jgi:acyl dehydratase
MPEPRPQLAWSEISPGDVLTAATLDITLRRLVHNAGASWEMFPGHHDREYARAQGHADVFANTSLLLAAVDRMVTDWAGPRTRITRRSLVMGLPVHPGETLRGSGLVKVCRRDGELYVVDIETELSTERGRCAHGRTSIALPS